MTTFARVGTTRRFLIVSAGRLRGGGGGGNSPRPRLHRAGTAALRQPRRRPATAAPPLRRRTPVPAAGRRCHFGRHFGVTSTGRLVTFDRADPALDTAIAITGLQSGETVLGIDVRAGGATPGEVYALGSPVASTRSTRRPASRR